jgi:thiosulfate reductase cytochrome b subunit
MIALDPMAGSAYSPSFPLSGVSDAGPRRHSAMVRVTHWISAISFLGLLVGGIGILLSHPRFYWGETGGVGAPSLFDLPLPFMLGGPSGWGRYLHFQSAWLCVFNGAFYVLAGLANRHFRKNLVPAKEDLNAASMRRALARPGPEGALRYNVLQRITYLTVIFFLFPLMIWTGLAMSPAMTSLFPFLVNSLGGHQSARTIHFFGTVVLVVFVLVHVGMICRAGFRKRMAAMITGRIPENKEEL